MRKQKYKSKIESSADISVCDTVLYEGIGLLNRITNHVLQVTSHRVIHDIFLQICQLILLSSKLFERFSVHDYLELYAS